MRVKRGPLRKNRRKRILKLAKGYWGMKSRNHRLAKQQVERSLDFAYSGRKQRKRSYRRLWIVRINAAARSHGISYSQLIRGLSLAGSTVDRKMLADLAVGDASGFAALADSAKKALEAQGSVT